MNTKSSFYTLTKLSFVGALTLLSGCAGVDMNKLAKEQKLTVTPNPLELHGDSVKFDMSVVIPVKMLKKGKTYTVTTTYKSFDNKLTLDKVQFVGNDFPLAATEPPVLSKKFRFGYDNSIRRGDVFIMGEMADQNKIGKKTPEIQVAKGIIITPLLVKEVYPVAYAEHGYNNREEYIPTVVNFYFQKGSPKLEVKEIKGERGKFFEKFVAGKYVTRTVNIIGTHSPEGSELFNEKLSEQRALAIEKYYRETMKKYNYGNKADSISFIIKGKVKDWSDFRTMADTSSKLNDEDKSAIKSIIDSPEGTFRSKEAQLQKLASYKILLKNFYPMLRNARTEVLTVKPKKSDAQIFIIAMKIGNGSTDLQDSLSAEEMLYAATLTPLADEKEKIYLAASKKLDSYEAHNNLGALYIEKAIKEKDKSAQNTLADQALAQFEIAKNKKETGVVYLNIATAKLMKGDKAGSIEAVTKARALPGNSDVLKGINAVNGVLDIKAGNYESALSNLSNAGNENLVVYNRALASLLKKDFTTAKAVYDEAKAADQNNAWAFYGAAITAVKMNDMMTMSENLKKAVTIDATLKAKALEDMEFDNVKAKTEFTDALK
ncbi:MAG: hypothetical protein NW207_04665 [Cytophagales bacterium]|nr:hypothetical protein [Cytophagales bacterium]